MLGRSSLSTIPVRRDPKKRDEIRAHLLFADCGATHATDDEVKQRMLKKAPGREEELKDVSIGSITE